MSPCVSATAQGVDIIRSALDPAIPLLRSIPLPANVCQVEYIWIGGTGADLRAKTKTLDKVPTKIEELPIWNYDGSSTGQAPGKDSEVYLQPVAMFADPFRGAPHLLVLCEACLPDGNLTPIPTNSRRNALKVMTAASKSQPWFGIEQEYSLFHENGRTPFGFPDNGYPRPQGPYYCSIGTENAYGRRVVEAHYRACLAAGLKISGVNAEVMPGQWEYQVGPCLGISSGDQMWISRYMSATEHCL
jgi:glutamine synthetase